MTRAQWQTIKNSDALGGRDLDLEQISASLNAAVLETFGNDMPGEVAVKLAIAHHTLTAGHEQVQDLINEVLAYVPG